MDFTRFPRCVNGDVLIVLEPENRELQLHADMLRRQSKFFRDCLTQENVATLAVRSREVPGVWGERTWKMQMVVRLNFIMLQKIEWVLFIFARSNRFFLFRRSIPWPAPNPDSL
jgi:hypothetical protein